MTIKEAIWLLKRIYGMLSEENKKALDVAIEVLEIVDKKPIIDRRCVNSNSSADNSAK